MDKTDALISLASSIITTYSEFSEVTSEDFGVCFIFNEQKYKLWIFEDRYSLPTVTIIGNTKEHPHYLIREVKIKEVTHQAICLFESTGYVNTILSTEKKIKLVADKFIELHSLSRAEIETEYQKEFLLYWGMAAKTPPKPFELYFPNDVDYAWLQQFDYEFETRIAENLDIFNDAKKCIKTSKIPTFFVKITDKSGLIPPLPKKPWDARQVINILANAQTQRISEGAYKELLTTSYSHKSIFLILNFDNYYFACSVTFKNPGTEKLIRKIEKSIVNVELFNIKRCDFRCLSAQIGNDELLTDKTILIIGAGSLGSYIAEEVVRAGCKSLIIADDDNFEPANVLRHRLSFGWTRINKSAATKVHLQGIHPEIKVSSLKKRVMTDDIETILSCGVNAIISTIGSSDTQLEFNQYFHDKRCSVPVIYSWLEGDGVSSHALCISYKKSGCFECLFTDDNGKLMNNKVNMTSDVDIDYMRNGCGGARVAYGNSTLLTGSYITLKALRMVLSDSDFSSSLYNFVDKSVSTNKSFMCKRCRCCSEN